MNYKEIQKMFGKPLPVPNPKFRLTKGQYVFGGLLIILAIIGFKSVYKGVSGKFKAAANKRKQGVSNKDTLKD